MPRLLPPDSCRFEHRSGVTLVSGPSVPGDTINLPGLIARHRALRARATLALLPATATTANTINVGPSGWITSLHPGNAAWTWPGVAVLDPDVADALGSDASVPSLDRLRETAGAGLAGYGTSRSSAPTVALLDRDGTILEDRHYLSDPHGVVLLQGSATGLKRLRERGFRLVVVTNQSGVGQGMIPPEALTRIHQRMGDLLRAAGAGVDGIYSCPHRSDDRCPCRKPAIGLVLQAARDLGFDPRAAAVIGDKASDIFLARNLGVPAILVLTGYGKTTLDRGVTPDFVTDTLADAAELLLHPAGLGFPVPLEASLHPAEVDQ